MTPYEVVAGPFTIWVAPVTTAFPKVDATPSGSWIQVGTGGTKNYDEKGVIVTHSQTVAEWRSAGGTGPRKAFRTEESLTIEFTLVDLLPAQYAQILNNLTVTVTPPGVSQAGESVFSLQQGSTVAALALLARGTSPFGDSFAAQYEVPIVYQGGSPKPTFVKGAPAMLDCVFHALQDDTLGFGKFRAQSAVHS